MTVTYIVFLAGIAGIFLALFVSLVAVSAYDNEARGVSKSLEVLQSFQAVPPAVRDEIDPAFKERVLMPLVDRLVDLGGLLTPSDYADRVRAKLEQAGNPPGWTVERVAAMKVMGIAALAVLTLMFGLAFGFGFGLLLVLVLFAAVLGYFAPNIYLHQRAAERANAMRKTFPDALDLLTISVEAGLGFDAALAHVARNIEGPLAHEFSRVLQEMQIGQGRAIALRALGERTTLDEMRSFVSAMVQADAFGIPIGQVLRVQSSEIRVKRRQRVEEQAQKLPVKILFPLILFILPCLFIIVLGPAALSMVEAFSRS